MKAYKLEIDYENLIDSEFDCHFIDFENIEEFRFGINGIKKVESSTIILTGNIDKIKNQTDFPINNLGLALFSEKAIRILEENNEVQLNKIDTVILDDTNIESTNRLLEYKLIQITNYTEAFDTNNSDFSYLRSNPEKIGVIKKMIFRSNEKGFPSIFRIKEKSSEIFISEKTKRRFEIENIKGYILKEIETRN